MEKRLQEWKETEREEKERKAQLELLQKVERLKCLEQELNGTCLQDSRFFSLFSEYVRALLCLH